MSKTDIERKLDDLRAEVAQLEELVALEKRVRDLREQVGAAPVITIIPQVPYTPFTPFVPVPYPVIQPVPFVHPWDRLPPYTVTITNGTSPCTIQGTDPIVYASSNGGVYQYLSQ